MLWKALMFLDRTEAGRKLAYTLRTKHFQSDLVIGLARGGVVISSEIARTIGIKHDVLLVNKIGARGNPELAVGALVAPGQSLPVQSKEVLIVDDGAATGETMKAAVTWVRRKGAKKVTVALPVAPPDVIRQLNELADGIVVLETPSDFGAVGAYYKNFSQLTHADVIKLTRNRVIPIKRSE